MKPQCSGLAGVSLTPYIGGGPWGSATPPTSLQVVPVGTHQTIIGYGPPTSGSGSKSSILVEQIRPEVIKLFSCSTQLRLKFILLINVKMPKIVFNIYQQDRLMALVI